LRLSPKRLIILPKLLKNHQPIPKPRETKPSSLLRGLLLLIVLNLLLNTQAQIDQRKLDSLKKSIDVSAKAHNFWQDSFAKVQDSFYQSAIKSDLNKRKDLREHREREVQRRRSLQRIMIALLLATAALVLMRRRKKKNT
jgi:hypothetical protein